jgi:hypothetical protein
MAGPRRTSHVSARETESTIEFTVRMLLDATNLPPQNVREKVFV